MAKLKILDQPFLLQKNVGSFRLPFFSCTCLRQLRWDTTLHSRLAVFQHFRPCISSKCETRFTCTTGSQEEGLPMVWSRLDQWYSAKSGAFSTTFSLVVYVIYVMYVYVVRGCVVSYLVFTTWCHDVNVFRCQISNGVLEPMVSKLKSLKFATEVGAVAVAFSGCNKFEVMLYSINRKEWRRTYRKFGMHRTVYDMIKI